MRATTHDAMGLDGSATKANRVTSRARWAAVGAAVAVVLGAAGLNGSSPFAGATTSSGERAIYSAINPCRLADTRPTDQVGPRSSPLGPGETARFDGRGAQGDCTAADLPADAVALSLNVTAVGATTPTFLSLFPDGAWPGSSSLNPEPGQPPIPNAVTTEIAADGSFRVFNNAGSVHVVIDVVGVYTDHNHDDRYYTKAESEARYGTPPGSVIRPHLAMASAEAAWLYQILVWERPAGANECLFVPVDLPVGATIDHVDLLYSAGAVADVEVGIQSVDAEERTLNVISDLYALHIAGKGTLPADVGTEIQRHTFADDPTVNIGRPRVAVAAEHSPSVIICTDDQLSVIGVEVHLS